MRGQHHCIVSALAAASLLATPVIAQARAPVTWSIRVDNDYFNFWQAVRGGPDEEYTQGAELSATWSGRPPLLASLFRGLDPCAVGTPPDQRCTRVRLAIGQDMYTPRIDSPQLLPGQRPYAGWLYASFSESSESRGEFDEISATIGVTGPPSLAEAGQKLWHGWFNLRKPLG